MFYGAPAMPNPQLASSRSRERMHLFKTYSQFSFDSSNGGATAVEFSHKKTDEKPCENLTSRSAFFTKSRWYPGAYSQISGAIGRASSRTVILNKGFAPNPVISASDPMKDELDRLQKIEKGIAERYGIPSVSYVDSVHLFQVVKDRANKTKDKESLSDLQTLDIILERRMELKTSDPSSHGLTEQASALSAELEHGTHFSCSVLLQHPHVHCHVFGPQYASHKTHPAGTRQVAVEVAQSEEIRRVAMKGTAMNAAVKVDLRVALEKYEEYKHVGVFSVPGSLTTIVKEESECPVNYFHPEHLNTPPKFSMGKDKDTLSSQAPEIPHIWSRSSDSDHFHGNMLSSVYLLEMLGRNIMKASRRIWSLLQMQKVSLKASQLLPDTRKNLSVIRLSNKQTGAKIGAISASSALDGISLIAPYTRCQTLLPFKLSVSRIKILTCNDYITEVGEIHRAYKQKVDSTIFDTINIYIPKLRETRTDYKASDEKMTECLPSHEVVVSGSIMWMRPAECFAHQES
ncbi:hypothetical protein ARMGADRAFT_1037073 [Armillaria gallica]|uniref:Uncharacterized protein n=1 Tax=Armillaria gallica TaxID=47427 RepID=A0A2H3D6A3_ARMGA|nr:hypothetical protein ARMGADRAFT_1037073 [Armillaria gallica]